MHSAHAYFIQGSCIHDIWHDSCMLHACYICAAMHTRRARIAHTHTRLLHTYCIHNVSCMHTWRDTYMMHTWYIHGTYVMYRWCMHDSYIAYTTDTTCCISRLHEVLHCLAYHKNCLQLEFFHALASLRWWGWNGWQMINLSLVGGRAALAPTLARRHH